MNCFVVVALSLLSMQPVVNEDPISGALETAMNFISLVDDNQAEALQEILHPQMIQFAKVGDKLMPFSGTDFVQLVKDKKLGGHPRSTELKSIQMIREGMVDVQLQAVSDEHDFWYQISLAQEGDQWLILTVVTNIKAVEK